MKTTNRTLTVILHYGSEVYTWNCVRSILECDFVDILIVDNDPYQNLEIPFEFLPRVKLFRTGGVSSFAAANNMGVNFGRKKNHDFVLILNNDTIVLENALQELLAVLNRNDVGVVGPCMPFADEPTKIWACGGTINRLRISIYGIDTQRGVDPYDVDYLPGAAIVCKLYVWDLVGGLPEKYFLAYEEAEFALRIKACGYRVMVLPNARILHHVGISSDSQPMYIYNTVRNRIKFGQYLFGHNIGFLLAMIFTMRVMLKSRYGYKLWAQALVDEIIGKPLDRAILQRIKNRYV
ncbi:glycosyltransferase [Methylovulum miyakonense]|uniref:glycosyltransferase n=1 Tax=Methylovulum miyakonense TaxID=645578 RepID=UPI0003AA2E3D|nr:glycosyltransferase family 2 protein [Methylovulum miyakonense]